MNMRLQTIERHPVNRGLTLVREASVQPVRLADLLCNAGIIDETVILRAELLQRDEGLKPVEAFRKYGEMT